MTRITPASPESRSADIVAGNLSQLKALFPEAFTEGSEGKAAINFEVLKQLLGGAVDEREEKYGLNWHGKRKARELALTPSTGTLRPCPEDSVDWDTTHNLMIEGDNLEVLKLLQKSYAGKVKLIYIDPPYNTGRDFVYPDNFQDNIKNYLELTGQIAGGRKMEANAEASGRFHTDWLAMMYPRLKLARNLLQEDGIVVVSISDHEVCALRYLMNDLLGEENFYAQLIWKSRKFPDSRAITGISTDHEYLLLYSKSELAILRGIERDESKFSNPDNDSRGPWMSRSILGLASKSQRPNLHYPITDPSSGIVFSPPDDTGWRYSQDRMQRLIQERCVLFPSKMDGRPREKKYRADLLSEFVAFPSIIDDVFTSDGTAEIRELFGVEVFDFTKPTKLLMKIIEQGMSMNDIIIDFFAGSGTTGHAVMLRNSEDNGSRRFILVQLPEPLDPNKKDQKTAADFCSTLGRPLNIAELTKERLRRAGKKIAEENPMFKGDLGFRVFKLDSSNIRAWDPEPANLETALFDSVDHIKQGRSEADILYELLLKLGLDLVVPIETKKINGLDVHAIGAGSLFVCLADKVKRDAVEALALGIVAWRKELNPAVEVTCVFRDSGFEDNVAKTNLAAILLQSGIGNVRSI